MSEYYTSSIARPLMLVYPHTNWQPWRFDHVPHKFWNDIENHKNFIEYLEHALNIVNMVFERSYFMNKFLIDESSY
jgi:hypothetical protein